MDTIKAWLLNVGLKTMGPSAIRGGVLGIAAWFYAKENMLAAYGIISDSVAHTTTIYWDKMPAGLIPVLLAAGAAIIKGSQYHGQEVVNAVIKPTVDNQGGTPS